MTDSARPGTKPARTGIPPGEALQPDLFPTCCLDIEDGPAAELEWLPYAVRFKLDVSRLRLSLQDWRNLPRARRIALLSAPLSLEDSGFEALALSSGARRDMRPAEWAQTQGTALHNVCSEQWLSRATPFAKYVALKLAMRGQSHRAETIEPAKAQADDPKG